ncbi:hypothetical protein BZA05DRAFT_399598 [Tricharina praecox]|uniref:uncharacterized protein n=1 Tax=Tricharina praecox TaxID=43433 RepID=UPI002220D6F2|nr:uncharacterized protein BZA05DRAFT_399598 [Tricharina praecox]KAI5851049.1 hypothetical protein BZA05DRAFT_399598 [Tricharina praecox]
MAGGSFSLVGRGGGSEWAFIILILVFLLYTALYDLVQCAEGKGRGVKQKFGKERKEGRRYSFYQQNRTDDLALDQLLILFFWILLLCKTLIL